MARRTKAVDEISFTAPLEAEGWLLGEIVVAAVLRWQPQGVASEGGAEHPPAKDPSAHVVQVFPGPRAVIVEASRAAVLYDADEMLGRGLRLRPARGFAPAPPSPSPGPDGAADSEASAQLQLSAARSVEGLQQLLRALSADAGGAAMRLPPQVRAEHLLSELERLVIALDPARAEVKKYGHFEAFFAYHWDWLTNTDALEVTFERWRRDPTHQAEAQSAFREGQLWGGSYFCTQGPTSLELNVTRVTRAQGHELIEAELTFTLAAAESRVRGCYVVAGRLEREGRVLTLEPVPGSWKDRPSNFVMVGLQGVVSRGALGRAGGLRFAGSVPIFGCDYFELTAELPLEDDGTSASAARTGPAQEETRPQGKAAAWTDALDRFRRAMDENRRRWRAELQRLIGERSSGSSGRNLTARVRELVDAARDAAGATASQTVTLEVAGEDVVLLRLR